MGPGGFGPPAFSMSRKRSNQLSYEPSNFTQQISGQGGSRTLTTLQPKDFKSFVYAIPPLALKILLFKDLGDERN